MLIRSLFSYTRLMPCYNLSQGIINKGDKTINVRYRMSTNTRHVVGEIGFTDMDNDETDFGILDTAFGYDPFYWLN